MSMTYTEEGLQLIAAAITEDKKVSIDRIELIADQERSGAALTRALELISMSAESDTVIRIRAMGDNYGLDQDYYFNRINVYAKKDESEVLLCYQQSATCPFYLPEYDGRPVQIEADIYISVSSTAVVNIVNDGAYILRSEFEEAMGKKVNVADIVQNAATRAEDKVPSAAVAAALQDAVTELNTNKTVNPNDIITFKNIILVGSANASAQFVEVTIPFEKEIVASSASVSWQSDYIRGEGISRGDIGVSVSGVYPNNVSLLITADGLSSSHLYAVKLAFLTLIFK